MLEITTKKSHPEDTSHLLMASAPDVTSYATCFEQIQL